MAPKVAGSVLAVLAALINLDLSPNINALDEHEMEVNVLGEVAEDTVLETKELDNDDEKKVRRHYELLKQGDVLWRKSRMRP